MGKGWAERGSLVLVEGPEGTEAGVAHIVGVEAEAGVAPAEAGALQVIGDSRNLLPALGPGAEAEAEAGLEGGGLSEGAGHPSVMGETLQPQRTKPHPSCRLPTKAY